LTTKPAKSASRADHLIEGYIALLEKKGKYDDAERVRAEYIAAQHAENMPRALYELIVKEQIKSPRFLGHLTGPRCGNLISCSKLSLAPSQMKPPSSTSALKRPRHFRQFSHGA
jgi:hypothetical protein